MTPNVSSVSFQIQKAYQGFAVVSGVLQLVPDGLNVEYEVRDCMFGLIRSGVKDIRIPYTDLESITYKGTLVNASIEIRVKTMRAFAEIPVNAGLTLVVSIARADRAIAEDIATYAALKLMESRRPLFPAESDPKEIEP